MPKTDHRKNLTPTLITGLKKARKGERYQVMDAQVPGFGVRVTDKGHKTFILRIRYPGSSSPARREIGKCVDITLTAAREKARKWRSLVAQGIDPAVQEEKERQERLRQQAFTFSAVADDFMRQKLSGERRERGRARDSPRSSADVGRQADCVGYRYRHHRHGEEQVIQKRTRRAPFISPIVSRTRKPSHGDVVSPYVRWAITHR